MIATDNYEYGDLHFVQSNDKGGDPLTGGTTVLKFTASGNIDIGVNKKYMIGGVNILPRLSIIDIDFGNELNETTITVSDTLITANSTIQIINNNEDLALQNVTFIVNNIIPNTSYDIVGIAPNGASGIYSIKIIITEIQ